MILANRCQWIYDPYFWGLEIYWVFGACQHRGQNSGDNCHEKNLTALPIKNYLLLFSSQVSIKKVSTSLRKRFSTRAVKLFYAYKSFIFYSRLHLNRLSWRHSHTCVTRPKWGRCWSNRRFIRQALFTQSNSFLSLGEKRTLRKSWKWTLDLLLHKQQPYQVVHQF